jgi:lipid-A-disaccharide synthase
MRQTITRAAVILPFEERVLRDAGIDTTFVGHPLLDRAERLPTRAEARAMLGLPTEARVLALFPGSRPAEIARHLDAFVATARLLEARVPGLRVIVSVAPGVMLDAARCPYQLVPQASYTVWRAADAALSKSGTSTLEAALAECPLVIAYRTGAITYHIARRLVADIKFIGLVNLVAGRSVAPEFIQNEVRPGAMAAALAPLLEPSNAARATMLDGLAEVRARLGERGAAGRVAEMALEMLRVPRVTERSA